MNKEHHVHHVNHTNENKLIEKKSRKSNLFLLLGIILLGIIFVLSYFGFIPVLSDIIGPKPVDLGIRYTEEDYKTASFKLGRERATLLSSNPENSLKFEGSHYVNAEFTSEEITATMQTRKYKYNPITDFQAKITDDKIEMSGRLMITNLRGYGKAIGLPEKDAQEIMSKLSFFKVNPTFYVKGSGSIVNNELNFQIDRLEIGRISVSDELIPKTYISRLVKERLEELPGLNVELLKLENGKLKFKGNYPDKTYYDTG